MEDEIRSRYIKSQITIRHSCNNTISVHEKNKIPCNQFPDNYTTKDQGQLAKHPLDPDCKNPPEAQIERQRIHHHHHISMPSTKTEALTTFPSDIRALSSINVNMWLYRPKNSGSSKISVIMQHNCSL